MKKYFLLWSSDLSEPREWTAIFSSYNRDEVEEERRKAYEEESYMTGKYWYCYDQVNFYKIEYQEEEEKR